MEAADEDPGLVAEAIWIPVQAEFDRFADLSGDSNPIHVDATFAAKTRFGRTVAHGMLLYARLSGLIGEHFPDHRTTRQVLMFPAPAFAGEALTMRIFLRPHAPTQLSVEITRMGDGATVLTGSCELGPQGSP